MKLFSGVLHRFLQKENFLMVLEKNLILGLFVMDALFQRTYENST